MKSTKPLLGEASSSWSLPTLKGKQLRFTTLANDRGVLKIHKGDFIDTLESNSLSKAPKLSESERADFRSVSGSLQWLAGQSCPEIAAAVFLSNKGLDTEASDFFETVDFLEEHREGGIIMTILEEQVLRKENSTSVKMQ